MLYEKNGNVVETGDGFIYIEEIYLKFPNRYELFRTKRYKSIKPIDRPDSSTYSSKNKCKIMRYWLLDIAPERYLKINGYKPIK